MHEFFQKAWYGPDSKPYWFLVFLSKIYFFISSIRTLLYKRGLIQRHSVPVPVIVIGNLTVGGTGKTPVTIALVNYLKGKGFQPGVVSRGYGGSADDFPLLVSNNSPVTETGDEPMLIYKRTGVPVVIDPKRARAAKLLAFEGRCDVIISDDGLQHHAMDRDFEIVVVDGQRLFGNGELLPAGPMREKLEKINDYNLVVLNSGTDKNKEALTNQLSIPIVNMVLEGNIFESCAGDTMASFAHGAGKVYAVAGIGNPSRFFDVLRLMGLDIIEKVFDDHHDFVPGDLEFEFNHPIVMTEKDAIKCSSFAKDEWWYLPVDAQIDEGFYHSVDNLLNIV